jgi:hypothetical protein
MNGMRASRASSQGHLQTLLVEFMDGVANGLVVAAEGPSDLLSVYSMGIGEQDLAAAHDEGIRRAQTRLQGLTLVLRKLTYENRFFHGA